jgi:hemerythrin-like metal-binding protein
MWYSIYTVGDLDIDQEHANIDYMLSSLSSDSPDFIAQLCHLIDTIIEHFQHEEEIAEKKGYNMGREHLKTHSKLKNELEMLKSSLVSGDTESSTVPEILQEILKLHILEFDRFLLSKAD